MIFRQSRITVQPEDCLFDTSEHSGYTTEHGAGEYEAMEASVAEALAKGHGHLTADHACWLHEHNIAWQINVERR